MERKTTVLVDTLRFPECPRWHEGKLWCSDFFARRVMSVDLSGNVQMIAQLEDMPGGLDLTGALAGRCSVRPSLVTTGRQWAGRGG